MDHREHRDFCMEIRAFGCKAFAALHIDVVLEPATAMEGDSTVRLQRSSFMVDTAVSYLPNSL